MFTGIVETMGDVIELRRLDEAAIAVIRDPLVAGDARPGESVAVNGVCLTVVDADPAAGTFSADVMKETLDRSALGSVTAGDRVNLERAATLGSRLGGHLVQGHVDGVGTVLGRDPGPRWEDVKIALPPELSKYVVEKGSITVDGVSLTVVSVTDPGDADQGSFTVSLIPTTLQATTLGHRAVGDLVNIEVDIIGKYVEKLVADREPAS
jgi:riboflavin synthase